MRRFLLGAAAIVALTLPPLSFAGTASVVFDEVVFYVAAAGPSAGVLPPTASTAVTGTTCSAAAAVVTPSAVGRAQTSSTGNLGPIPCSEAGAAIRSAAEPAAIKSPAGQVATESAAGMAPTRSSLATADVTVSGADRAPIGHASTAGWTCSSRSNPSSSWLAH
jgi:hypothetical protein